MTMTVKEARETIVWVDQMALEDRARALEEAGYILLAEVERLGKIEDGLRKLIGTRKQVVENIRAEAESYRKIGWYKSAEDYGYNADRIMAEVWPLEAILDGEA